MGNGNGREILAEDGCGDATSAKMFLFIREDGIICVECHIDGERFCSFYANGRHVLSAGQDRAFRLFSIIQVKYHFYPQDVFEIKHLKSLTNCHLICIYNCCNLGSTT